ncbi:uncharacterized protein MKZ38_002205 [Zalerion maritima]|uniref:Uncharacterized protein n=1 Tax=Zalerion maritima TaxID=339359 RepID=A0AAD5RQ92_9PEZI|nr:uncharacterized protein MKZ38_002205 [Zalerion maritima]
MKPTSISILGTLLGTIAVLVQADSSFDPNTDVTCPLAGPCLTSFIWCGWTDQAEKHKQACSFPDNVDPESKGDDVPVAILYQYRTYNITWKNADDNYPVLLEWLFENSTLTQGEEENDEPASRVAMWGINVTNASSFSFTPRDIFMADFPNDEYAPEIDANAAAVGASGVGNAIRVSQPEASYFVANDSASSYHTGDQFSVQNAWAKQTVIGYEEYYKEKIDDMEKKWRIGVGVGVGVGVPVLMAAAFFGGRMTGKESAGSRGRTKV